MGNLYLGFDAGTQSVKVSVYDEKLECLTSQSLPTSFRYPNPGWVEMDLDDFLGVTLKCIKRCAEDLKRSAGSQRYCFDYGRRRYLRYRRCKCRREGYHTLY